MNRVLRTGKHRSCVHYITKEYIFITQADPLFRYSNSINKPIIAFL